MLATPNTIAYMRNELFCLKTCLVSARSIHPQETLEYYLADYKIITL